MASSRRDGVGLSAAPSSATTTMPPQAQPTKKGGADSGVAFTSSTLLRPLLVVGVAVWALQLLEIPPDVAETTLVGESCVPLCVCYIGGNEGLDWSMEGRSSSVAAAMTTPRVRPILIDGFFPVNKRTGGITIDKWHRSLETLTLLYGCWQARTINHPSNANHTQLRSHRTTFIPPQLLPKPNPNRQTHYIISRSGQKVSQSELTGMKSN
jgi:hypothetical protein